MRDHFSGCHVVVIDDNRDLAEALVLLIETLPQFTAEAAFDGRDGAKVAALVRPAAAILDIEMPGMNGFEAAATIRAEYAAEAPVLIAMTGNPNHFAAATKCTLFDHALLKPFEFEQLFTILCGSGSLPPSAERPSV
jgi:CheY-like chemotaxis protein